MHIHAHHAGQVIDFHRRNPQLFESGEIDTTRTALDRLQQIVTLITRAVNPDPDDYYSVVRGLGQIAARYGKVRDVDKIGISRALAESGELYDESGILNPEAVETVSRGVVSAVRRYTALQSMIGGTETVIRLLIIKGGLYDERLRTAYRNAGVSIVFVEDLIATIEEKQRQKEDITDQVVLLRAHNRNHIQGRIINALAVLKANPYYAYLHESEISALSNIGKVIELWDAGRGAHTHLYRIKTLLHTARSRLERLATENLSVQYQQRIRGMRKGDA